MPFRDACWLAILAVAGLAHSAANAQQALPRTLPAAPPSGVDRIQALITPQERIPDPGPVVVEGDSCETCPSSRSSASERKYLLSAGWINGLRFASADDSFHVHVGGNAQIDSTWLIAPKGAFALPNGSISGAGNASATFLRRARLRVDGDIYDQFDFVVEYDFANANNENDGLQPPSFGNITGSPSPANIWMQVRDVPFFGSVRLGNIVKPIGLTNNTSQTFLPFLERADNMDAFYGPFDGGFALGLVARNHTTDERITWQ